MRKLMGAAVVCSTVLCAFSDEPTALVFTNGVSTSAKWLDAGNWTDKGSLLIIR